MEHLCYECGYECDCGAESVEACWGCSPCGETTPSDEVWDPLEEELVDVEFSPEDDDLDDEDDDDNGE